MSNNEQGLKYQPLPAQEELAQGFQVVAPEFRLCRLDGATGTFHIPVDIRQRYLQDPVRSPEWREILKRFDAAYAAGVTPSVLNLAKQAK